MDDVFTMKLKSNGLRFKQTLDRLADKYGKLQQCEDEPLEVDMDKTLVETLEHYMALSKKKVETLSKSFVDYKADSQPLRDGTIYSQGNDTSVESGHLETVYLPGQDEATSLLDDSCTIFDQPEDHDEQLEMSLQSQGSSLGEVYMDMLSQIGEACQRQHVSDAADSVSMKYRRLRESKRQPNNSLLQIAARRKSLDYPNLRLSSQLGSPQMDKARRHHSLRRNLSFDSSSLTSSHDFDNDFKKLYHQLVCLNKTMKVPPCKFCLKSPDAASREHSSLNLAALALSPHQRLGKRHELNNYPQSKRFKDGHFTKYL
uniref:Uncharacterized protein n=1 Tax=Knipowitschia caucasica TaxID=637954 RepID=A0AAV2KY30_KNICA